MPQDTPQRKVKKHQQMIQALDLRAAGASYRQIGEALSVSKPRAFRIVRAALDELVQHCEDTAERVRRLELYRLDKIRIALDSKKGDPRVADTLIRISERVAKLHGLDAPQRIDASVRDGGPIETEEKPDYSKLTLDEMLLLEAIDKKARGIANWDENLRRREESQRRSFPGVQQPETWTEGLKKLGILTTAPETPPAQSELHGLDAQQRIETLEHLNVGMYNWVKYHARPTQTRSQSAQGTKVPRVDF
jgi:Uncharacterized conserved protein (DUF2285)